MDSFNKFLYRLEEVKNLKEIATALEPPMDEQARKKVSALNRASIVMLCSHLEGYFEDLISEFVEKLCKSSIPMVKVPAKLKVACIKKDLTKHNYNDNLVKELFVKYNKFWVDSQIVESGDFDGERINQSFGNPGSTEVEDLFANIGIPKIWRYIPYMLKTDLDAIVKRRNDIAHGNLNSTVSSRDIERYFTSGLKLARKINKKIDRYFNEIIT